MNDPPTTHLRSRKQRADEAASDIVATTLLVALTLVLATGFSAFALNMPGPVESPEASLTIQLDKGAGGWGTGDEQVRVRHKGGAALQDEATHVHVTIDGTGTTYTGAALGDAFADGWLRVGETWRNNATIQGDSGVIVSVVSDLGQGSRLLAQARFTATDCSTDDVAPAAAFTQTPANVRNSTTGGVTITVDLDDACSGVDVTQTPHLHWRIDDEPTYTDLGPMTYLGGESWQATIPDPGWNAQLNKTLQYYAAPLVDLNANSAASTIQSEIIDYDACGWDTTPPSGGWTQSPADVTMNTTGALTATLTATDGCAGVDDSVDPTFHWRIDGGGYTDAAMTRTGTHVWQATLADPGWLAARGKTLEYYASGLTDVNGNAGSTGVEGDLIDNPCGSDATPPTASFVQSPNNVSVATTGAVTVTASLSDDCAGVDASVTPDLHWRVDAVTYTSTAMTSLGGHQWQANIPDPSWSLQGGDTLEYYVAPLTDRFGNTGQSALQSDEVDILDPCVGDVIGPTGSFAQSPLDVTMNTTGQVRVTLTTSDDCAGVDEAAHPVLNYRLDDGADPAYTSLGAMSRTGVQTWQANITATDWLALRGNTLQYYASGLTDLNGNAATTSVQSDLIDDPCAGDTSPPTASFFQSPGDVTTQTVGAITVTATLSDACAGVDGSVAPNLFWRVDGGSYIDAGAMTSLGGHQWQGIIPAQAWSSLGNQMLQYQASPLSDRFTNSGSSTTQSDLIEVVVTHTYVAAASATRGTLTDFSKAQDEDDLEAGILEAPSGAGAPTSTALHADSVRSHTFSITATPAQISGADGTYAADQSNAQNAHLAAGFANPGLAGTILGVQLKALVQISAAAASGGIDAWTMQACMASCGTASGQLGAVHNTWITITYNVTTHHPNLNATWTWSDLQALEGRVNAVKNNGRDGEWRLDHLYVEVIYASASYDTNVAFTWTGVPTAAQHDLEIRHRVSGDTFQVQLWDGAAWNARGTLTSATAAVFTYTMTNAEHNGGAPRVRFVDLTPAGTTQGQLLIDYARVKST